MPSCDHCLLEIAPGDAMVEDVGGKEAVFCCPGCRNIHALLRSEGLEGFYARRRGWTPGPFSVSPVDPEIFTATTRQSGPGGDLEMDLAISGIRCASCVWVIERYLAKKPGVLSARVHYATHRGTVRWDPARTDAGTIAGWIAELGYAPFPGETTEMEESRAREKKDLLLRLGTAAFLSSQIMMITAGLYAGYFQGIEPSTRMLFHVVALFLATPVLFYSGYPFLANTVTAIRRRAPGMDTLVFLGSFSAYAYSVAMIFTGGEVYFDTTAMIITLILLGRYLEASAKGRASESIARLFRLAPVRARRIPPGEGPASSGQVVPVSAIRTGDIVEVIPGERVPADGIVSEGESEVDESMLSGEARPVDKGPGSRVFTGTVNGNGRLRIEVSGTGRDTVLSRIIRAVEEAQARKSPVQGVADRVVGVFVPSILLVSLLALGGRILAGSPAVPAFLASISVLVVACPCALGLATPLAAFLGSTEAQSLGILVKGADVLEKGSKVDTVFLDKTGTLTQGSPRLTDVVGFSLPRREVLEIAASLEASSEHAMANAIRREVPRSDWRDITGFRAHPGMGVEGTTAGRRYLLGKRKFHESRDVVADEEQREIAKALAREGKTVAWLSEGRSVSGLLAVEDTLRPESPECVRRLTEKGYTVWMVTGDAEAVSARIAGEAGIVRVLSPLTPPEKAEAVRQARSEGSVLLMVGDGINDAPALTEADVGLAMGRGTDIALESADAVLMNDDLLLVPRFLAISRNTMRIIRQNLFWAFSYNAIAIPLAVAGKLHPIVSAGLMAISSLVVVGNSLRLRKGNA
ncbi:MAG: heavy metal translocating P-type ATPase [Candidatus Deferrimicrobiaceae bacterium]